MDIEPPNQYQVAVIGAGPAGLYASRQLANQGVHVVLFNRDIKPGGLAEYGIYPTKYKMKSGLRKQFRQILETPQIDYFGNVKVGQDGAISLDTLRSIGFHAILVTVGAQGTKWLGLPGEELTKGVYHAKDLVYHYNRLPPYSQHEFVIGRKVALVGVGNVMLDIARWLIRQLKIDEVIAVARRGPAEVKFDKKEMEYVIANLDLQALDDELARAVPVMEAVGQDPSAARESILAALPKALEPVSHTRFRFDFLASPTRILDERGVVCGLEVEDTTLVRTNGETKARSLGSRRVIPVDTVIFCIGDRVDDAFGLPVRANEFVKNPNPSFPVDGLSYEAYDPQTGQPVPGMFVAGWSREASSGLVGIARKDGERGAQAILAYLQALEPDKVSSDVIASLQNHLNRTGKPVVTKEDIWRLEAVEEQEASRRGLEEFKFSTNEEMLTAIKLP